MVLNSNYGPPANKQDKKKEEPIEEENDYSKPYTSNLESIMEQMKRE